MTVTFDIFQFSCQSYWKDGEKKTINKKPPQNKYNINKAGHTRTHKHHTLLCVHCLANNILEIQ